MINKYNIVACVSFMQAGGGLSLHVPAQVDSLVKNRLRTQFAARRKEELAFDNAECAEKGSYYYTMDSIVLQGNGKIWKGRMEANISDAIDGRRFEFPGDEKVDEVERVAQEEASTIETMHVASSAPKWLPWVLGIGAVAIIGGMAALHASSGNSGAGAIPLTPSASVVTPSGGGDSGLRRR